ncbi:hypothetical protein LB533_25775 [Mesorhizobium sp. BR1-1-13]|uniref:hypothetical protein n=1 Tax=Mesorhizobium sp. BR1-1-13 TaxID=2876656 RepID=UPI001CD06F54|nr:hypothetical protein [Mesorhizobium sp. BR1-1-13]MBZ9944508.1 hypothetical protein [Mesorhizobium sp. BR1-1-13]
MKNWLTLKPAALPAKAASSELATKADFDRKVAEFRRASGKLESCRLDFVCAKTGEPFCALFDRASAAEKFAVAKIEKIGVTIAAPSPISRPALRSFDANEFSFAAWRCPCCGSGSFVHCACGQNSCQAKVRQAGDGRMYHTCEPGCGSVGEIGKLRSVQANSGGGGYAKPQAGLKRPALPKAGNGGLLTHRKW